MGLIKDRLGENIYWPAVCQVAEGFRRDLLEDPMTAGSHAPVDEIIEGWMKKHVGHCAQCRDAYLEANTP